MTLAYRVDTSLFDRMSSDYQARAVVMVQDAVVTASRIGAEHARSHHPHTRRSGLLTSRGMLHPVPVVRTKFGAIGGFQNVTLYARWVEFGNGPPGTRIYPKSSKVLRWKQGGIVFFARSVKASRPFPFMWPAQAVAVAALSIDLDRRLTQIGKVWN